MRSVVKNKNDAGNIELQDRPLPLVGENDILIKVMAAAICGTDVHINDWDEWSQARVKSPVIIGHEFVGEVTEVGDKVKSIKLGDIVSAESHIVCNVCKQCREGQRHVCPNTKIIGANVDGGFAEYVSIPAENAFVCNFESSIEVKSLMEPLGAAVHAMMEYPISGKKVAIIGCGPIGLMGIAIAKFVGAKNIIAVEPNEYRRDLASKMGATHTVDPIAEDVSEFLKKDSNKLDVDIAVDFSGNTDALNKAISYLKPEGKLVALGLPPRPGIINVAELVYKGITWKGIAGRKMYETWEIMSGLLGAGLDIQPIVTHVMPLEQYEEGLELMKKGMCGKVILIP